MQKQYNVYIPTNRSRSLYIGFANNLARRAYEHKLGLSGFTARYKMDTLVHMEVFRTGIESIRREKQLKGWDHAKKVALIEENNLYWEELPSS